MKPAMDQAARDAAYNNSEAVKDSADRLADWTKRSAAARAAPGVLLDIPYGPAPRNRIDYFPSGRDRAPLFVFIHGGYWQRNSKEAFAFVAEGPAARGFDVAVVGYTLAPEASLSTIVAEISAAIDHLHGNADTLGFDPARIFVGGWSAGGHLAAVAARHPFIRGVLSISGLFDLAPIAGTYINDKLSLDQEEIRTLSPMSSIPSLDVPYLLYVGGDELPELRRQTTAFADTLRLKGVAVTQETLPGFNHFTIIEELASPDGILAAGLARMTREEERP